MLFTESVVVWVGQCWAGAGLGNPEMDAETSPEFGLQLGKSSESWREGMRIVDVGELARQMYCKFCKNLLDLNCTEREARYGLASIFFIICQSCAFTNEVCTGKYQAAETPSQRPVFDVNAKASDNMLFNRRGTQYVVNFLAVLHIPLPNADDFPPPSVYAAAQTSTFSQPSWHQPHGTAAPFSSTLPAAASSSNSSNQPHFPHHSTEAAVYTVATNVKIENNSEDDASGAGFESSECVLEGLTGGHEDAFPLPQRTCRGVMRKLDDDATKNLAVPRNTNRAKKGTQKRKGDSKASSGRPGSYQGSKRRKRTAPLKKPRNAPRACGEHSDLPCKPGKKSDDQAACEKLNGASSETPSDEFETDESGEDAGEPETPGDDWGPTSEQQTEEKKKAFKCPLCSEILPSFRGIKIHVSRKHHAVNVLIGKQHEVDLNEQHVTVKEEKHKVDDDAEQQASEQRNPPMEGMPGIQGVPSEADASSGTLDFEVCDLHVKFEAQNEAADDRNLSVEQPGTQPVPGAVDASSGKPAKKSLKCDTCGAVLANNWSLKNHKRNVHTTETEVVCDEPGCGHTFKRKELRDIHTRNRHTKIRPFFSPKCKKGYATKSYLTDHVKRCGTRPYKCPLCGQMFGTRMTLREHRLGHDGLVPVCSTCGKIYATTASLRRHRRIAKLCFISVFDRNASKPAARQALLGCSSSGEGSSSFIGDFPAGQAVFPVMYLADACSASNNRPGPKPRTHKKSTVKSASRKRQGGPILAEQGVAEDDPTAASNIVSEPAARADQQKPAAKPAEERLDLVSSVLTRNESRADDAVGSSLAPCVVGQNHPSVRLAPECQQHGASLTPDPCKEPSVNVPEPAKEPTINAPEPTINVSEHQESTARLPDSQQPIKLAPAAAVLAGCTEHSLDVPGATSSILHNAQFPEISTGKSDTDNAPSLVPPLRSSKRRRKTTVSHQAISGSDTIVCPITGCHRRFSKEQCYKQHLEKQHKLVEPQQCPICQKVFLSERYLKGHITRQHTSKEGREVECPATFAWRNQLVTHERIHSGEKPFQCYYCELRFRTSSNRFSHVRRMHTKKTFLCDTCGAGFHRYCR
ncbi:hypothetical protein BaRGS_00037177, partial [Batillaria attramentaria]